MHSCPALDGGECLPDALHALYGMHEKCKQFTSFIQFHSVSRQVFYYATLLTAGDLSVEPHISRKTYRSHLKGYT